MPVPLSRFDHITLIVADVQRSRDFYVGLLGMTESKRPDFKFPGAWFELQGTSIHITQSDEKSGLAGWGDRQVSSISRGHHFAMLTDDFDAALNEIRESGIMIADGPKTRPDGAQQIYIFDPDRHVLEICTTVSKTIQ